MAKTRPPAGRPGGRIGKAGIGPAPGMIQTGGTGRGTQHKGSGGGGKPPAKKCCFAGQAVKAVWLGKFRLARRFARLDLKTRLGVI